MPPKYNSPFNHILNPNEIDFPATILLLPWPILVLSCLPVLAWLHVSLLSVHFSHSQSLRHACDRQWNIRLFPHQVPSSSCLSAVKCRDFQTGNPVVETTKSCGEGPVPVFLLPNIVQGLLVAEREANMPRGRPRKRHLHLKRMEEECVDDEYDEMYHGVKLGEYHRTDIQVAINEGNTREDAFFIIRIGKASSTHPFQQQIPIDFARYHQDLYMENVIVESPCGREWNVLIRPQRQLMRFCKGWRQFAVGNHLREGYSLIFTRTRRSHFVVKFFDNLGKNHVSFPPLPSFDSHSQFVIRNHQHDGDPQPSSAAPQKPLCKEIKDATLLAKPPAPLNCNQIKSIHHNGLTQHSEVLRLQATVPRKDMSIALEDNTFNTWNRLPIINGMEKQAQQRPRAVREGKNYIDIDSDDDDDDDDDDENDDLSYLPAVRKQNLPKLVTSMRDATEVIKHHIDFNAAEPTGHFSSETQEMSTPTYDIPSNYLEGRRGPVTRTTVVKKGPFRQKLVQLPSNSSSSAPFAAATVWRGYHEVEDPTGDGGRKATVEGGGFVRGGSRAMQLLEEQGCLRFSDIVSQCSRLLVSDQERSRVVEVAERFANTLENAKFVVVMRDAQVYHDFHLVIPQAILEATRMMRAKKVKVFLTDNEKSVYVANWEWHSSCDSTLLSSDGWARFALDHAMEEGDVCVFELIDSGPAFLSKVLHVHIFRVGNFAAVHHISDIRAASGPASLNEPLEVSSSEGELKQIEGSKQPISDVHRLRLQWKLLKPRNLQPWPKVIKRGIQGRRALRQY